MIAWHILGGRPAIQSGYSERREYRSASDMPSVNESYHRVSIKICTKLRLSIYFSKNLNLNNCMRVIDLSESLSKN